MIFYAFLAGFVLGSFGVAAIGILMWEVASRKTTPDPVEPWALQKPFLERMPK